MHLIIFNPSVLLRELDLDRKNKSYVLIIFNNNIIHLQTNYDDPDDVFHDCIIIILYRVIRYTQ